MDKTQVRKGNRILDVEEKDLKVYLERGYDQIDEDGEVVTPGKSKGADEKTLKKALKSLEDAKKTVDILQTEKEALRAERDALQARVAELEAAPPAVSPSATEPTAPASAEPQRANKAEDGTKKK